MAEIPDDPAVVHWFSKKIFDTLGIVYQEKNLYQLESRLRDILSRNGFESFAALQAAVAGPDGVDLLAEVLDLATNNETMFFRDRDVFDGVRDMVLPAWQESTSSGPVFKVWCAACSTGQEPWSLAMLLAEFSEKNPEFRWNIQATDFSNRVLEKARSATYNKRELDRGMTGPELERFFTQSTAPATDSECEWALKPEIRRLVSFHQENLMEQWDHPWQYNLIFCRNVLIYQNQENKAAILKRLREQLLPGGFLVLGSAETIFLQDGSFEIQNFKDAAFYQKRQAA